MKAILWDGHKQIKGDLILEKKRIKFRLADFSETDLDFDLAYQEIRIVNYHRLFEVDASGIEIISENRKQNIFIVEQPTKLKKAIEVRCGLLT